MEDLRNEYCFPTEAGATPNKQKLGDNFLNNDFEHNFFGWKTEHNQITRLIFEQS